MHPIQTFRHRPLHDLKTKSQANQRVRPSAARPSSIKTRRFPSLPHGKFGFIGKVILLDLFCLNFNRSQFSNQLGFYCFNIQDHLKLRIQINMSKSTITARKVGHLCHLQIVNSNTSFLFQSPYALVMLQLSFSDPPQRSEAPASYKSTKD